MDTLFKFLDDLLRPGNWPFLVAFIVVLLGLAVVVFLMITASVQQEGFNRSFRIRSLWIHLYGGEDDPKIPRPPKTETRLYRKLLYVKVNFLARKETAAAPFYQRVVRRLDGPDQLVPVYDEAVYYTLKLFPGTRKILREQDQSSGVVDPRVVIPWAKEVGFNTDGARRVKEMVDMESTAESDTMLTVSHFLNGLQEQNQTFCTEADEDAESLRLIVDFSSITNAGDLVKMNGTPQLLMNRQPVETDDLHYEDCGGSVYMAHCKNAKRGSVLEMHFTFKNWNAVTA